MKMHKIIMRLKSNNKRKTNNTLNKTGSITFKMMLILLFELLKKAANNYKTLKKKPKILKVTRMKKYSPFVSHNNLFYNDKSRQMLLLLIR